jgi:hypothetical protein
MQKVKQAYTVDEVAEMTGFSRRTVISIFEHKKGTLIRSRAEQMHKRRYRAIRTPHPVFERVIKGMTV